MAVELNHPRQRNLGGALLLALPTLVFLGTFGVFFVDKNRQARTVLSSGRGLVVLVAVVGGYAAISLLVRRLARQAWVAPLLLSVAVLVLAAWIVRPYYVDETANRRLIAGPVDAAPTPTTASAAPPLTKASPAPATPGATTAPAPATTRAPAPTTSTPAAPVATRLSTGEFAGLGHTARGKASIIRAPDKSLIVRFENFDIEGVPDPRVYLVPSEDARRPGGVSLGKLRGNRGDVLDFPVPAGTDAGAGWTVLVWCEPFSVPVANATQGA